MALPPRNSRCHRPQARCAAVWSYYLRRRRSHQNPLPLVASLLVLPHPLLLLLFQSPNTKRGFDTSALMSGGTDVLIACSLTLCQEAFPVPVPFPIRT